MSSLKLLISTAIWMINPMGYSCARTHPLDLELGHIVVHHCLLLGLYGGLDLAASHLILQPHGTCCLLNLTLHASKYDF